MSRLGLSQAELARRIGISQATINKLAVGHSYGSKHLHRIARVLGTTPAYLEGESDDPGEDAAPPPPAPVAMVMLPVALPSEDALTEMFEGLLDAIGRSTSMDALPRELAQLLPTGLSQLRGLLPDVQSRAAQIASARAPAIADPGLTR